jgi:bifunctional non-homologous end joining protein LigD
MAALERFAPLEVGRRTEPFDHEEWFFELKYDGFRARAEVFDGKAMLFSRRGHLYRAWPGLCDAIGRDLLGHRAVLDGELICPDEKGRPIFLDLLYRRRRPVFVAFDLLHLDGEDLRDASLVERKALLARLIPDGSFSLLYAQHVVYNGRELFRQACALDLEGIVAKLASAPYRSTQPPHWLEIKNPAYSQGERRQELFERKRDKIRSLPTRAPGRRHRA